MATHRPTPPSHFRPRTTICVQSHAGNLDQARRQIDHVYRLPSTNRRRNGTSQPGTGTISPRLLQLPNRRLGRLPPIHGIRTHARSHSATGKSPFHVWYGFQPTFMPPVNFATAIPTVEERLRTLDQIRSEVTASLKVAAEIMKRSGPNAQTHRFKPGDRVWLEGTNIHTTHPKAKLAPRRHGPFEVISATEVNSKLKLPKTWRLHPVFHNSLLTPYKETAAHGPNYTQPPPEVINGEGDHYEIEKILQSRLTPNRRGVQYLVTWKGYPDSERTWLPATQMKHAADAVKEFHMRYPKMVAPRNLRMISTQHSDQEIPALPPATTRPP